MPRSNPPLPSNPGLAAIAGAFSASTRSAERCSPNWSGARSAGSTRETPPGASCRYIATSLSVCPREKSASASPMRSGEATPTRFATALMRVSAGTCPCRRALASRSTIASGLGTWPTRWRRLLPRPRRERFARAAAFMARRASETTKPQVTGESWVTSTRPSISLSSVRRYRENRGACAKSCGVSPWVCAGPGSVPGLSTAWNSSPTRPAASNVTASRVSSRPVDGCIPVACVNSAT